MLFFSQASPAPPCRGKAPLAKCWLRRQDVPLARPPHSGGQEFGGFLHLCLQQEGLEGWGREQHLPEQTLPWHPELLCPAGASPCHLLPRGGVVVKVLGVPTPPLGGVGFNSCVGASAVKSSWVSGSFALFLGITLTRGEMRSSDEDIN